MSFRTVQVLSHSINGSFAIRQGNSKLELCPCSGGWSDPKSGSAQEKDLPPVQLYDHREAVGEKKNLKAEHPEIVSRLTALLQEYVAAGRSTPGTKQTNDVKINLWKRPARAAARRSVQP